MYIWFTDPAGDRLAKPHRRSEADAIEDLIRELTAYEPKGQQLWVPNGPLLPNAPALPLGGTEAGAKFYAAPVVVAAPSTILFAVAGFEVGLAFTTMLTARQAWAELQRLVDSHDKEGVDLLLITAGGPDQRGMVFPAEEALFDFLLTHPVGLTQPPRHIHRVVVHSWMTGRASLIHPVIEPLFGPLYQSLVPLHHPIAGKPGQPVPDATGPV